MLSFSARNSSSILCSNSLVLLFEDRPNDPQFKADPITENTLSSHTTEHGGGVQNG
jgi:hypothetical protein